MKILIKHDDIINKTKEIAQKITQLYNGKEIIVVCVLKGAAPFHSELVKHIKLKMKLDYIQVKSYSGSETTGIITLKKDLDYDITNKDVIIVEDIIDTGNTLYWLKNTLEKRKPNSLTFVTLLDKPSRRKINFKADFSGFVIDDLFVYGFGLDLDENYRNLKDIYVND